MVMFGERLKYARELGGVSRRELSGLAGLSSPTHVDTIEKGGSKSPEVTTAAGLASALGCSLEWLITGEGVAPNTESVKAAVAAARARRVQY